jgi:deazaflavin-dependent oxidoreductase (nitroreductase family)
VAWIAPECPPLWRPASAWAVPPGRPVLVVSGGRGSSAHRPSAGLLALATLAGPADGEDVSVYGIAQALRGLAQRLGGTRLGVLAIGRIVSPLQRQLYRRTGGRLSLTGRAPVLLLTTTGRRTGKARTVPLLYLRDDDRLVICNVNPGFERPNPWVVNLRAQPHAQVQIGRATTSVSARLASDDELDRYWPQLTKVWPAYQAFYANGGKRSVFVLEPDAPLQHMPRTRTSRGTGSVRRNRASGSGGDLDDCHSRGSAARS